MLELKRMMCIVNTNVIVWTWDTEGRLQPPLVLRPGTITEADITWGRAKARELGMGNGEEGTC